MSFLHSNVFSRLRGLTRLPVALRHNQRTQQHRKLSVRGIYRTTPTELHCYSPDISSSLFAVPREELEVIHHRRQYLGGVERVAEALGTDYDDAVIVRDGSGSGVEGDASSRDGLVYPLVIEWKLGRGEDTADSNGALFYPNSPGWSDLVHLHAQFIKDGENGRRCNKPGSFTPHIFTVPRGTPIPDKLVLFHEHLPELLSNHMSRYSLQPSAGMSLKDLNRALDKFYSRYASKEPVEEWLKRNPDTMENGSGGQSLDPLLMGLDQHGGGGGGTHLPDSGGIDIDGIFF